MMISIEEAGSAIAAIGAVGTAAYGLVDVTKVFGGGVSRAGFGHVEKSVKPYISGADTGKEAFGSRQIIETLRANWMNGMAKADQKASAKALIRLKLKPETAAAMATLAGVNPEELTAAATRVYNNETLTSTDTNALGAFDVAVSATLDLGYERGDQLYRNMAKMVAALIAIGLMVAGTLIAYGFNLNRLAVAVMVGLVATPLAPVAKDLSSALQSAVKAASAFKR